MKITDIQTFPVFNGARNNLFVTIDTDEGIDGVGESGLSGRELAVIGAIEHMKPLLIGQDATRIEHLWQMLFRGGFFPANRVIGSAISAIDIALWDIAGKALNVPIYRLLGGLARDKVVCYPHAQVPGETDDVDALVDNCRKHVAEGWKFLRWGLPQQANEVLEPRLAVRTALRQFELVRQAVGDDIELCLDIHTRLDLPDSVHLCREAEKFRPFFMEDPLRAENPHLYRRLREQTAVPIAAGEQFAGKWEFRELIEEDLIDYCRVDLCIAGGITEARKIAGWCETHAIKLVTHNPLGPVSSAACLQLNLATSNVAVQEQPRRPGTSLTDVVPVQVDWQDGYLLPPTRPGLGVVFDRDAARRSPFQMTEPPHLHRLDGSFTNW
ncbi:MAG: mandelate racemase/muconate lactonizing enzyme family protein [Chloroflexi bacterium]|nr:mandelate racemase/muconate lactonizing enzyme family protein [Chloroflexota bacterium]